jgi:putative DNA primase/helicase
MSVDQPIDRAVEIERLAALDTAQYEIARNEAADKLGYRASVLDKLRDEKRRALRLEGTKSDDGQGRPLTLPEVMPWPDPVEGDRVAEALKATFKRYIRMSDAEAAVCALWVLLSWTIDKFSKAPRLAITSPTKGCGKTTLLTLLSKLCRKSLRSGSTTPSVLFRAIEILHPTFLLDESEKFLEVGSEFHALLNQGHARGDFALRNVGDNHEPRMFDTFCLAAFARNGRIPDDLEQRSIVIELQRRLPGEKLDVLRDDQTDHLGNLARMCSRWADDYADDFANPDMGGLINRTADNWRPLFAIADLIGSDWPMRIREAAQTLIGTEPDSDDTILLADIKATFEAKDTDRLSSEEICETLVRMEGRPWAEYGKNAKSISKNQLAKRLKRFKVVPDSVRISDKTPKGYYRHQFQEVWDRYLSSTPQEPLAEPQHRNNTDEMGISAAFQSATEKSALRFENGEKPLSNGHCCGVAVQNPLGEGKEGNRQSETKVCEYCGKSGDLREIAYGEFSGWLHRGCEVAWMADCDLKDIPPYLDRRGELQP